MLRDVGRRFNPRGLFSRNAEGVGLRTPSALRLNLYEKQSNRQEKKN